MTSMLALVLLTGCVEDVGKDKVKAEVAEAPAEAPAKQKADGDRIAVDPAQSKLSGLGARHLFEVVVANGGEGGPTGLKPSPAGYLAAADGVGLGLRLSNARRDFPRIRHAVWCGCQVRARFRHLGP